MIQPTLSEATASNVKIWRSLTGIEPQGSLHRRDPNKSTFYKRILRTLCVVGHQAMPEVVAYREIKIIANSSIIIQI